MSPYPTVDGSESQDAHEATGRTDLSTFAFHVKDANNARTTPSTTDIATLGTATAVNSAFPMTATRPLTASDAARLAPTLPFSVGGSAAGPFLTTTVFPLEAGNRIRPTSAPMHHPIAAPPTTPARSAKAEFAVNHAEIAPLIPPARLAEVIAAPASAMTVSPGFNSACITFSCLDSRGGVLIVPIRGHV